MEKILLAKIQKIAKRFPNEICGHLNLSGRGSYKVDLIGDETSVPFRAHKYHFHTHPSCQNWKYGGPPSVSDLENCFSHPQITCYVIGQKYIYKFKESDLSLNRIENLKENREYYAILGLLLELEKISMEQFMTFMEEEFDIIIEVYDLYA